VLEPKLKKNQQNLRLVMKFNDSESGKKLA